MTFGRIRMASFPLSFGSPVFSLTKHCIQGASLHAAAWVVVSWLVVLVAGEAPARHVYGMICGWWASLYCGHIFSVPIVAAIPVFLGYCGYGLIAFGLGSQAFYHAMPDKLDASVIVVIVVRALAFTSPIVINGLISHARGRWSHHSD